MTSYRFSRRRPRRRKSTSGFPFGDVSYLRRSKTICVPNFAKIFQSTAEILLFPVSENKRPPYWILHPVSILMSSSSWKCDSPLVYQPNRTISGDFEDGGRQPCWICFRIVIDHPRSVIDGLNFVLEFRLDRIYSFRDSAIFVFAVLAGKCIFTVNFRGFWDVVPPNDVIYRRDLNKDTPCAETRHLSHKAWKSVQRSPAKPCIFLCWVSPCTMGELK